MARRISVPVLVALFVTAVACNEADEPQAVPEPVTAASASIGSESVAKAEPAPAPSPPKPSPPPEKNPWVTRRPGWLGKRILPLGPEGFGEARPTPPILRNRRLATIDTLPPPRSKKWFARIGPVPPNVVERSTWRPKCPVTLEQLSYITMPFWGFDHEVHAGEMIVNASVAEQVTEVFREMFEARFEIEEMRVVTLAEQRAWNKKPTGDVNVTSSFECRPATLGSDWSQHAYGLAIDINPFHNPYLRGSLIVPELATAYTDRSWERRGMVLEGGVTADAFDGIGWGWGGRWSSLRDWMHFSQNGH